MPGPGILDLEARPGAHPWLVPLEDQDDRIFRSFAKLPVSRQRECRRLESCARKPADSNRYYSWEGQTSLPS
jgi:hypothetical protein